MNVLGQNFMILYILVSNSIESSSLRLGSLRSAKSGRGLLVSRKLRHHRHGLCGGIDLFSLGDRFANQEVHLKLGFWRIIATEGGGFVSVRH